ncbi:SF1B family DNA helicase RecD2 [Anthocerotibacter panamensis]|uniref:SF1B family DNA helicase RecD2 n=1 Tax=Anthocerotibacter panamensis TaxID=2857077 RepID=UPI001C4053AD|nr:ATP-dependent RecD-like DNA helicase [Anthocerotibacter panamensis]
MSSAPEILQALVERVTYHNPENGYSVLRVKVPRCQDVVTAVGSFAQVQPGQTLALSGVWRNNPRFGPQFEVLKAEETRPATLNGIEKYLGSGLIKGVGPVTARRIVRHFGLETLEILEGQPERIIEVKGVGKKRVEMIRKAWLAQQAIKEVMVFLQSHGVSTLHAVKIYKTYQDQAIATVQENPYRLAQDIYGIGFKTADQIAQHLGVAPDSTQRLQAALAYTLLTATEEGHCFLPLEEMIEQTAVLLELDLAMVRNLLTEAARLLTQAEQIVVEDYEGGWACYAPALYYSERNLARRLLALLRQPASVDRQRVDQWLERYTDHFHLSLSDEQQEAVRRSAQERVLVLTGGPGTGKTTTTRTIVALWRAMGKQVLLASPTGRAAQRLSEVTGQEAKTIHRLLEFDPKNFGFKHNEENPLACDAVVIDEASMIDVVLAYNLLKAIPHHAQLLLVGDQDQLPSVGPGNVLRDLLGSDAIPVVRLNQVFRQAAQSLIVTNAHCINRGQPPTLVAPKPEVDCWFIEAREPEMVVDQIQALVSKTLPGLGYDPFQDVQILSPMNRGLVGATHLNTVLQNVLNPADPAKAQLERGNRLYRVGDRVIQRTNDYTLHLFNGDLGQIQGIDLEEQQMEIVFGERTVEYDFADLNELGLAFAVSIHKSQGSEYPVCIIPVHTQHFPMLSRQLIYTGLTRARKLAILVGTRKALGIAIRKVGTNKRYTRLAEKLTIVA